MVVLMMSVKDKIRGERRFGLTKRYLVSLHVLGGRGNN